MPRASHGVRHTVSVLCGAHNHVVFDVTSKVVDFVVLCNGGKRDSSSGEWEQHWCHRVCLVWLTNTSAFAVNLVDIGALWRHLVPVIRTVKDILHIGRSLW